MFQQYRESVLEVNQKRPLLFLHNLPLIKNVQFAQMRHRYFVQLFKIIRIVSRVGEIMYWFLTVNKR